MSGQIVVNYVGGDRRIVNLHKEFFTNTQVFSGQLKKMVVHSPTEKAKVLAEIYGQQPLLVVLTQGGNVVYKKEYEARIAGQPNASKVALAEIKKLRKEFKGYKDTAIFNSFRELKSLLKPLVVA